MNEIDPDYYHSWEPIDEIEKETNIAILVSVEDLIFWVAKSLIRRQKDGYIFVHSSIFEELKSDARKARKQMERLSIVSPIIDPFVKHRK